MIKRLAQGIGVALLVVILPALWNRAILGAPHLWILFVFGVLASVLQPGYNPFTITAKPKDRGTGAQIIWSVYVSQVAMILESAYVRYPRSVQWDFTALVALVAMTAGLGLRTWAVFTLGDLFTMHIDIQKGHSVVRAGPFKIVRHPSYLGAFIMYGATIVFFHAWISLLVAALVLPVAFLRRMHYEEELLLGAFGKEYEAYSLQVKRILPGIW